MLTPSQYTAFITTVDTTIGAIYTEIDPALSYKEYATTYPISGSQVTFGWTGLMPKARPWFGSRVVHEPAAQTYTVNPVPYELTYAIERFTFDDSAVNTQSIFWRELPDMARSWRRQPEYEIRDLLEGTGIYGGAKQLSLDNTNHFNTAHPISFYLPTYPFTSPLFSGGSYCNDFIGGQTVNGVTIGGALSQSSFSTLLQYMQMIPGEDNEALGIIPNTLLIPATLQVEANILLKATFWAPPTWGGFAPFGSQVGAADNVLLKMGVKPVINRFLRKTTRWYLMDTSHNLKPFLWIVREAPRTVPRINENDPIVFDSHRYTWGGWDRVAPAFNFPWLVARSGPVGG